jgi:hypothetical protein
VPFEAKANTEAGNSIKFVAHLNCVKYGKDDRGDLTFEVTCEDCDTSTTKVK